MRPFSVPFGLVPILAGLIAFALAPWGERVWDDKLLVQQVGAFGSIADLLRPPPGIAGWSYSYYRPVGVLTYVVDARLFGAGGTVGPHLVNVLLHLAATGAFWMLARRLLPVGKSGEVGALVAAVVFAAHPIHVESVSWIAGRVDILATVFLLAALVLALRWLDRGSAWALFASPACFLLAMLGKEVAVSGIAILPLVLLVVRPAEPAPGAPSMPSRVGAGLFAPLAIFACWVGALWSYFALRAGASAAVMPYGGDLVTLMLSAARATAWYLAKLVVPWPQLNFVTASRLPGTMTTVLALAAAAAWLGWAALRWRRSGDGVMFLAACWIAFSLAPLMAALLPGLTETPVAERYLYLPSAGMALAAGCAVGILMGTPAARAALPVAGTIALLYLAGAVWRSTVWLNEERLWADAVRQAPDHAIPWIEYGSALQARGAQDEALEAYLRGLDLVRNPMTAAIGHYKLGTIYADRADWKRAGRAFTAAVDADPGLVEARIGQAIALLAAGELQFANGRMREAGVAYRDAVLAFDAAARVDPGVAARPELRDLRRRAAARAGEVAAVVEQP